MLEVEEVNEKVDGEETDEDDVCPRVRRMSLAARCSSEPNMREMNCSTSRAVLWKGKTKDEE